MSEATLGSAKLLGKYQIRGVIGRGAMGTVLEAWDPVIDRRVAIKTVKLPDALDAEMAEELQRFKREAQAAGRLSHPNIVGVYDYGETAELAYIVMEFVDGQSVKAVLDGGERYAPAAVARLMEDLLSGLQYSHQAGVIHRDLKPANIMLTKEGRAKIADFGIARIESSMTQAGTVLGTPAYMSPEQFRGETVDLRTDVYSSAVLLYQLLTGERPFKGNLSSIMHKALTIEPPFPSSLSTTAPTALDAVVARGMAKRPDDRYASAAAFMEAIRAALAAPALTSDETVFARPAQAAAPARPAASGVQPARSRLPLLLGGAGAIAIAAAAAVAFLTAGPRAAPDRPVEVATAISPAPAISPPAAEPGPATIVPVPAIEQPPPPPSPAMLRKTVAAALETLPCSAVSGDLSSGGDALLHGFTAAGGLPSLRQAVTGAGVAVLDDSRVFEADSSTCDTLATIAPIVLAFGATATHLGLEDASHGSQLADGGDIRPRVQMPNYAATLLVDYYAHDGTVEHIFPRSAADLSRVFPMGELVPLGDPGPGHAVFQVGEPYGRDMIVAIASAQPVFRTPRPHTGSKA